MLVQTHNIPTLKKFCFESKTEHSKEIDFCEDYRGKRKALLRLIEAIDLTKSILLSCTTQGIHTSSSKLRFRSAIDYLHQANYLSRI